MQLIDTPAVHGAGHDEVGLACRDLGPAPLMLEIDVVDRVRLREHDNGANAGGPHQGQCSLEPIQRELGVEPDDDHGDVDVGGQGLVTVLACVAADDGRRARQRGHDCLVDDGNPVSCDGRHAVPTSASDPGATGHDGLAPIGTGDSSRCRDRQPCSGESFCDPVRPPMTNEDVGRW